jgi:predicted DNA-binding transcriptional regulator YafY
MLLLQSRGGMTASELAAELEVSVRTIHRDVEALIGAGVPVYEDRGPYGGIRLVDGYRTRQSGLTGDEAEAIFLSGLPGPAAELGLGTVVAAARLKVLASLPGELRTRAARLVERFHLDAAGWFQAGEPVPHLTAISDAVWESRRLRIVYTRATDSVVERVIDPLGVVLKGGVWYLVAVADDQTRTYRVSRVTEAETLSDRFERPPGFDLATYWTESSAAYEESTPRVEVIVRVDRRGMRDLMSAVGERVVMAADQLSDPEEGWSRLRLRLDWPEEAAGRLLGAGPGLEVVEPPEVRRRVIALARAVVERYPDPIRS